MKHLLLFIATAMLVSVAFSQTVISVEKELNPPELRTLEIACFLDQNTGWMVGNDATILKTTNAGEDWEVQSSGASVPDFTDVFFVDANTGWVVGSSGTIWKTINSGADWTDQTDAAAADQKLTSIYAIDADTVFVVGDNGAIAGTTDGGTTWVKQDIDGTVSDYDEVYAFDGMRAFAVSDDTDRIVAYTEDGAVWQTTTIPTHPMVAYARQYGCWGASNGTAYSVGYNSAVYKSTDYAKTWEFVTILKSGFTNLGFVSTTDGDHVWTGGSSGGLYYSANGGADWDTLSFATGQDPQNIEVFSNTEWCVFANSNQYFKTTDNGQTYIPMLNWFNGNMEDIAAYGDILMAVDYIGGDLTMSTDGGATWSYPTHVTNAYGNLRDITIVNENLAYYAGHEGQLGKSTDGGLTWGLHPDVMNDTSYYFITFFNERYGMAGGEDGVLQIAYQTDDVLQAINAGTENLFDGCFLDSTTAIVVADNGKIFKSTDLITTWTEVADFGIDLNSVVFIDDSVGFVVADAGCIYKSMDYGDTWSALDTLDDEYTGVPQDLFKISFVSSQLGFICGEKGIFYESRDAGSTWNQVVIPDELVGTDFNDMAWVSESTGFITADQGHLLRVEVLPVSIQENPDATIIDYQLAQNYPNPFNPTTTIEFAVQKAGKTTLTVYSLTGQKVATLLDRELQSGKVVVEWDASHVASGMYFYELKSGAFTSVKKMLLIK